MWSLKILSTEKAFPQVVQGNCIFTALPVSCLLTWSRNLALLEKRPPQMGQPTFSSKKHSNVWSSYDYPEHFHSSLPASPGCDSACVHATWRLQRPQLHSLWIKIARRTSTDSHTAFMVQDYCMAMLGLTWPATLKRFLPSQGIGMISQVQVKVLKIQVNWSTFSSRRSPGASSSCLG